MSSAVRRMVAVSNSEIRISERQGACAGDDAQIGWRGRLAAVGMSTSIVFAEAHAESSRISALASALAWKT